jgi:hypothetical protein
MTDMRTHTHTNGWTTEIEAFTKALKSANSIKLKILEEIHRAGNVRGLTPDEFVEMHGGLINTIRRRFTDLWKEGMICHHPEAVTRENSAGNKCVSWVLGNDPTSTFQKRTKRKEWQGLTMEELDALVEEHSGGPVEMVGHVLICAAEDKLKEKNT